MKVWRCGSNFWEELSNYEIELNFKLDKNIKELRLRTMLNQNKNNFEISL